MIPPEMSMKLDAKSIHVEKVYPEKYRTDALMNMKECATNSCKCKVFFVDFKVI